MLKVIMLVSTLVFLGSGDPAVSNSDTELKVIKEAPEGSDFKMVKAVLKGRSHNCDGMKSATVRIGFENSIVIDRMEPLVARRVGVNETPESRIKCEIVLDVYLKGDTYAMMSTFELGGTAMIQSGHVMSMSFASTFAEKNHGEYTSITNPLNEAKVYPFNEMAVVVDTDEVSYKCGRVIKVGFEMEFSIKGESESRKQSRITVAKLVGESETGEVILPLRMMKTTVKDCG